ncbi:MAG TPA: hypothetical protein VFT45_10180 [Longimicrobium sp.]|nr:hypothetical protein [Longimicrobium sp.]
MPRRRQVCPRSPAISGRSSIAATTGTEGKPRSRSRTRGKRPPRPAYGSTTTTVVAGARCSAASSSPHATSPTTLNGAPAVSNTGTSAGSITSSGRRLAERRSSRVANRAVICDRCRVDQ